MLFKAMIKERTMNEIEYVKFVLADTTRTLAQAAGIYAVALTAYWTLIG
jgi:hypothetical protein